MLTCNYNHISQTHLISLDSGHGGQTICRHDSEVDGHDEGDAYDLDDFAQTNVSSVIYEFAGGKIMDNVGLRIRLLAVTLNIMLGAEAASSGPGVKSKGLSFVCE